MGSFLLALQSVRAVEWGGGHLVLISSQPVLRFIDHLYSEGVMGGRGP